MSNGQTPNDNRLDVIARAREHLLLATNIISSPKEMEVLDDILFRAWQMGWLAQYDTTNNFVNHILNVCEGKQGTPKEVVGMTLGVFIRTLFSKIRKRRLPMTITEEMYWINEQYSLDD